jgi:hypothetical protein
VSVGNAPGKRPWGVALSAHPAAAPSLDEALAQAAAELDAIEAHALADTEATLLNHGADPEELRSALDWQRVEMRRLRERVEEMVRAMWWTGRAGRVH